ncbi:uncharacterized protein LOC135076652 [Ostrinia nubilalis]|uniref:uncharacterized protein LOC135076652 n=1 Tax=Ostrinia nubilalis TaxID=29057 RepID=UPI003082326F
MSRLIQLGAKLLELCASEHFDNKIFTIFWLLILSASAACAGIVMRQVLSLYSGEAVTYLVDTNYLKFDTTFPAVTVCEQANAERVAAYTKRNKLPGTLNLFLKDMTYWSARVCSCTGCRPGYCTDDFLEMVKTIRAGCKELLTDCWWADEHFSCCDRFLPIETEFGTCFVFNSRLTGNETALIVNRKIGLPNLVITAIQDVAIRVHSPDDMCTVGMENALGKPLDLPMITDFEIILTAEETLSEEFVTSMPPRVRGCLLKDERPSFVQE